MCSRYVWFSFGGDIIVVINNMKYEKTKYKNNKKYVSECETRNVKQAKNRS